jgi:hypothetical protein
MPCWITAIRLVAHRDTEQFRVLLFLDRKMFIADEAQGNGNG